MREVLSFWTAVQMFPFYLLHLVEKLMDQWMRRRFNFEIAKAKHYEFQV